MLIGIYKQCSKKEKSIELTLPGQGKFCDISELEFSVSLSIGYHFTFLG